MIGSVKTRALENNPDWCIHLAQGLFSALRATGQRSIGKLLVSFKLNTAIFTPVGIDRHTEPQTYVKLARIITICSNELLYVFSRGFCKFFIFEMY